MGVQPAVAPSDEPPAARVAGPAAAKPRSLAKSVGFGLAMAAFVVGALLAGKPVFFVLVVVVVTVAQAEFYGVLRGAGRSPVALVGLVSGAALLVGTYMYGAVSLPFLAATPLLLLLVWAATVPQSRISDVISSTYLGIVYGPVLAAFALLILRSRHGLVLVPAFVGMTAVCDAGAYLVGRKFGRHRMAPRTSGAKSWEGFAAGVVISVGLSVAVLPWLVPPFDLGLTALLAAVVCFTTPLGDLAESVLKRDLGVSDMGSLLPGHGGVFDRIDSILFNAPVAYLVLRLTGVVS